ncbi:hypothetical protein SRB5_51570 [Streptomyces sp. RB5]|uniref:Uncharacterized protein n=1 Tax=Streptomyces smaragdinus TaxID=2585196 RepID=A0A7K0CNC4_9ACTN|nr:hypothetical protein [Streptomyces smaragdinus]MQY14980.1 hypothetical protein [Streptomyces smaragdinus]
MTAANPRLRGAVAVDHPTTRDRPDTDTPGALADRAAEAIRALNHATLGDRSQLSFPGDAYAVVGPLVNLARRLPQSFDQLAEFLDVLDALVRTGYVAADRGDPSEHLATARSALTSATSAAQTLMQYLDLTHRALGPLGWSGPLTDDQ